MEKGQTKKMELTIPKSECRFYLAATKPPAAINVIIQPDIVTSSTMSERDYFKSGKICAPLNLEKDGIQVVVEAQMLNADGQYSMAAFYYLPAVDVNASEPPAANDGSQHTETNPTPKRSITKILCMGEFEGGCPGAHDIWVPCGTATDEELARNVCQNAHAISRRTATIGGNRCGYTLVSIECL